MLELLGALNSSSTWSSWSHSCGFNHHVYINDIVFQRDFKSHSTSCSTWMLCKQHKLYGIKNYHLFSKYFNFLIPFSGNKIAFQLSFLSVNLNDHSSYFLVHFYHSLNHHVLFILSAVLCLITQLCPTHWDFMDCNPPGSSVHGILQARILEWVAMPSSRGSAQPKSPTLQADSLQSEPPGKPYST